MFPQIQSIINSAQNTIGNANLVNGGLSGPSLLDDTSAQPETDFFSNNPSPLVQNQQSPAAVTSNQAQNEVSQMTSFMNQQQAPQIQQEEEQEAPLSEREQIQLALSSMQEQESNAFDEFQTQLDSYASGAFALSPEESKMIEDIDRRFDILKRRQMVANQSLEGGFQQGQATSGLARYAPELAALEFNQIQNQGIEQLREIDINLQQTLDSFMDNLRNSRIQSLKESYTMYNQRLKMRKDLLSEMRLNLNDYERYQNSLVTNDIREYEYALSQGYSGSFMQFKKSMRPQKSNPLDGLGSLGSSSVPDLPTGINEDGSEIIISGQELARQLQLQTPPSWFNEETLKFWINNKENLTPEVEAIASALEDEFRRLRKDKSFNTSNRLKRAWESFQSNPALSGGLGGSSDIGQQIASLL